MAPTPEDLSAPGTAKYDSNTMVVGDGTWDFTKNTFLLPNLVGFNFETMRYNGMGNRFATVPQYHTLVRAHGVMAAITFLGIVPFSIMTMRFYTRRPGRAMPYHAMGQVLAGLLLLAIFILGYFCVGPERSLTNPHHGIGTAIFVLFILQLLGGRLIKHIRKGRSFRIMVHQWSGRTIALLGIIQVPLGLTLYGSPKYTFILYALWMSFLLLLYFILEFKRQGKINHGAYVSGGRSEGHSRVTESEYIPRDDDESSSGGGKMKWLGPLAAGAGILALMKGRKKAKERSRSRSRSRGLRAGSRSRSRSYSRSRGPEVLPSRRGSPSYFEDEKYTEVTEAPKKGGFMGKLLGVGAALGAAKLVGGMMGRKDRGRDDEYSAVSTETPSRLPPRRRAETATEFSEVSDYPRRPRRLSPPRGRSTLLAQSMSAAEPRPGAADPITPPRAAHARTRSGYSMDESEMYESPSRRVNKKGGLGKTLLAGLGVGWLAKKMAGRKSRRDADDDEDSFREEDERRSGLHGSRYTGDGHPSPSRSSRRYSRRPSRQPTSTRPPASSNILSENDSSIVETRPPGSGGPPMPPYTGSFAGSHRPGTSGPPPAAVPMPRRGRSSRSQSRSRNDVEPVTMPAMPPDPALDGHHDSRSSIPMSPGDVPQRRGSSRRRRAGAEAAAAAAANASMLAAEEENRRRRDERERDRERDRDRTPSRQPASATVKMTVRDDRVNLRRLTDEEAAMQRRRRGGSVSSISDADSPSSRRYRRDSSQRRMESAAERQAEAELTPLSPPNPAFAAGGRRAKDSAYYSGQPGPSAATPPQYGQPVSSLGSESHGTWSGAMSPSPSAAVERATGSAAENRRRRRLERRRSATRPSGTDMFD